mgnify:CR=1 FL=1
MIWPLLLTFLMAAFVALATAFTAALGAYPGTWWLIVTLVGAIAQGLLALYKHQTDPPA